MTERPASSHRSPTAIDWDAPARAARQRGHGARLRAVLDFPVGAAALVDDGRVVSGCNVENASYGLTLCAECALVSALHMTGGGKLVAFTCVDGHGNALMPCGRCRQLLYEHSAEGMLLETVSGIKTIDEVLPDAFGPRSSPTTRGRPTHERHRSLRRRRPDPHQARRRRARRPPQIDWLVDAYTRGYVADEQMSAMTMAIFLNGMARDEIRDLTLAMIASGRAHGLLGARQAHDRQALHRRRRRQDHAAARAARRVVRRRGAAALRPRARPHRRHARQARERSRAGAPTSRTRSCSRSSRDVGAVDLRRGRRPRPGRQQALRAARHHRHGRGDPADRVVDHVEEDRRGHGARSCST